MINKNRQLYKLERPSIFGTAFATLAILLCISDVTDAYEKPTHARITQHAIEQAPNYKRFLNSLQINANNQVIEGSVREDDLFSGPLFRPRHHFYDPTNGSGLISPLCALIDGCKSSLQWGLNDTDNDYSWTKARQYMYEAFTSPDQGNRSTNFDNMFRSLGQVIHLVQDLASPAHVRNDLHLFFFGLERDLYELYSASRYNPPWGTGYPTVELGSFSAFWNSSQGLAVFTNRNFISQGTNLDDRDIDGQLFYNLPQINGVVTLTKEVINQFGNTVEVQVDCGRNVIQDTYTGEVITNDCLTAYSVFNFEAQEILGKSVYSINDFTMESAANILIRRAVGYSAGLLDYFFRGQLHVMLLVPSTDVLSMSFGNANDTGPDIDSIALFVQNRTMLNGQIEAIGNGTLTLMYRYQNSSGSTIYGTAGSVVVPGIPHVLDASSFSILFSLPQPIPRTASDLTYYLTFRGQLGNEADAVIGKAIKAPMLHSVSPEDVVEGTIITLTGDQLGTSEVVFEHDLTKPYSAPVQNQDNGSITLPVPDNAGVVKLSYGGIRVRNILNTGERVYSNPVSYFPTAQGVIRNFSNRSGALLRIEALRPILGNYGQIPPTFTTNPLDVDEEESIEMELGFIYNFGVTGLFEKPVIFIRPGEDFIIELLPTGFFIDLRN